MSWEVMRPAYRYEAGRLFVEALKCLPTIVKQVGLAFRSLPTVGKHLGLGFLLVDRIPTVLSSYELRAYIDTIDFLTIDLRHSDFRLSDFLSKKHLALFPT